MKDSRITRLGKEAGDKAGVDNFVCWTMKDFGYTQDDWVSILYLISASLQYFALKYWTLLPLFYMALLQPEPCFFYCICYFKTFKNFQLFPKILFFSSIVLLNFMAILYIPYDRLTVWPSISSVSAEGNSKSVLLANMGLVQHQL